MPMAVQLVAQKLIGGDSMAVHKTKKLSDAAEHLLRKVLLRAKRARLVEF